MTHAVGHGSEPTGEVYRGRSRSTYSARATALFNRDSREAKTNVTCVTQTSSDHFGLVQISSVLHCLLGIFK